MTFTKPTMCHCGRPLHYRSAVAKAYVEEQIALHGADLRVVIGPRAWMVPRHYLACHGLKAAEVPKLGFTEVPA